MQLDIFKHIEPPAYRPGLTIKQRFEIFDNANPQVAEWLLNRELYLRRIGVRRYGMKALFEVLRYDYTVKTKGNHFKVNNNFTAYYARKLMEENAELDGFFNIRVIRQRRPV